MPASRVTPTRTRLLAILLPLFLLASSGVLVAGCAGQADPRPAAAGGTSEPMGGMHSTQQGQAAWAARPAYVRDASPRTAAAYAYAMDAGDVLEWLPCYCGCAAMGHGSNLDCYFKRHAVGDDLTFDEHASFCQICVDISLAAKGMREGGRSLLEIRRAVDAQFGQQGPGTDTPMPPAG